VRSLVIQPRKISVLPFNSFQHGAAGELSRVRPLAVLESGGRLSDSAVVLGAQSVFVGVLQIFECHNLLKSGRFIETARSFQHRRNN
jgi:hypothetical protein